ncbi:MAG: biopolymer transporter ExbD [Pseudomonadota bacterium]
MSMSVGGGESDAPMGEMNTTPLIDVMLCLLVMMILSIPIQTHAVKIDLPVGGPPPPELPMQNKILITAQGVVLWNGVPVNFTQLTQNLEATKLVTPTPELQFEPDPYARYAVVDSVLALIKQTGVAGLGFVGNERYAREF